MVPLVVEKVNGGKQLQELTLYCTVLPYGNIPFISILLNGRKYKINVLLFSCEEGSLLLQYEKQCITHMTNKYCLYVLFLWM